MIIIHLGMELRLVRIFPIKQFQMPKHRTELKRLDPEEIQLPSILQVRDPKMKFNLFYTHIKIYNYMDYTLADCFL